MLTLIKKGTTFNPSMYRRINRLVFLLLLGVILQSCYTVIYAPETLPQSVTSVTSEPAMASSLGGSGAYGWDPYWEPVLPYTGYYNSGYASSYYGSSYYNPYNYYDYQHSYYQPVYINSEETTPVTGRSYGRESSRSTGRTREAKTPKPSSNGGSLSTASPAISAPAVTTPVVTSRKRPSSSSNTSARRVNRGTTRVRNETPKTETRESSSTEQEAPKKRKRTKK